MAENDEDEDEKERKPRRRVNSANERLHQEKLERLRQDNKYNGLHWMGQ